MAMKARYTVIDGEIIAEKRNGVRRLYVPDPLGSTVALVDNTQVQTDTFMNYAIMRAGDMPPLTLGETITPNPFNPLGVKGVGECGTNGAPPVIATDPASGTNKVLKVFKYRLPAPGSEQWAGVTVSTGANDTIPAIPFTTTAKNTDHDTPLLNSGSATAR